MIHTYSLNTKSTGLDRALSAYTSSGLTKHYHFNDLENIPDLDKCDVAIFGNLLPQQIIDVNHPNKYYIFCSPFGQADLSSSSSPANEIVILYQLLEMRAQGVIKDIIVTDVEVSRVHKCFYIPTSIDITDYSFYENLYTEERHHYGFLGNNLRKHRNFQNQIVAMTLLDKKLPIVINSDHIAYQAASQIYGLKFEKKILDDEAYWKEIATHLYSFQATYSESFNYMALEYALVGVPTICCADVGRWYPEPGCVVNNIDSPMKIAQRANLITRNGYWPLSERLHKKAKAVNESRKSQAADRLQLIEKGK